MHIDHNFRRRPFKHFKVVNGDLARSKFHFLTFARHFVSFTSLYFYGRVGRGGLFDLANKCLQSFFKLRFGYIHGVFCWSYQTLSIECSIRAPSREFWCGCVRSRAHRPAGIEFEIENDFQK